MNKDIIDKYNEPSQERYKPISDRSFTIIFISIVGFFIGFTLCVAFYSYTLISIFELSQLMVAFAIIGFFVPLKYYRKWFHFIKYEMIIFNILGVAPFLTGLFLVLNFTFISNAHTHMYRIEKVYFEGDVHFKSMGVVLENNFFSGERKIVELTDVHPQEILNKQFLKITISEGVFGFNVIKEKVLIK